MNPGLDRNVTEEDDWEVIPVNWWSTSFTAVSWAFSSKQGPWNKSRLFQGSLFLGLPPRLNSRFLSLNTISSPSRKIGRNVEEDNTLNQDLVGVKSALDTVVGYEKDVGFYFTSFPDLGLYKKPRPDLSVVIEESDLEAGKERWKEVAEDLLSGPIESDESLESSLAGSYGDFELSASTLSSIDLTYSEASIDSIPMPSTPKPKLSVNEVEIKEPSPTVPHSGSRSSSLQFSPSRSLNASASSFVPSFFSKFTEEPLQFPSLLDDPKARPDVHSPGASLSNFIFPSLNPNPTPVVKIKKDDQGFFTEVQVEKSSGADAPTELLPAFLQESTQRSRTRKSRTREIVDRIRSRTSPEDSVVGDHLNAISPKYASHSPSPIGDEGRFVTPRLSMSDDGGDRPSRLSTPSCIDDEDGWIDIAQPVASDSPSSQKSKRTRELFLALTRRRTDSLSSADVKDLTTSSELSSSSGSRNMSISPSPSPSPLSPPSLLSNDGWIESSFVSQPEIQQKAKAGQTHNRKKSSNNNQQHRNQHQHHNSRASISSSTSQHAQRPFSATSPVFPQLSPTAMSPQLVQQQPQMMSPNPVGPFPYFFPATYPAVALPSPYAAAFMQVPTFPMVHAGPGGAAMAGVPYMAPTLMPIHGVGAGPVKPPMPTTNMPANRTRQAPTW